MKEKALSLNSSERTAQKGFNNKRYNKNKRHFYETKWSLAFFSTENASTACCSILTPARLLLGQGWREMMEPFLKDVQAAEWEHSSSLTASPDWHKPTTCLTLLLTPWTPPSALPRAVLPPLSCPRPAQGCTRPCLCLQNPSLLQAAAPLLPVPCPISPILPHSLLPSLPTRSVPIPPHPTILPWLLDTHTLPLSSPSLIAHVFEDTGPSHNDKHFSTSLFTSSGWRTCLYVFGSQELHWAHHFWASDMAISPATIDSSPSFSCPNCCPFPS